MNYSELLLDPRWQKLRLDILYRDNWACLRCRRTDITLHVHHKKYIYGKLPWEYPPSNFETLCVRCHKGQHDSKPILNVIGELIKPPLAVELMNDEISDLELKLRENISDAETEDILKKVMLLIQKRNQLKRQSIL